MQGSVKDYSEGCHIDKLVEKLRKNKDFRDSIVNDKLNNLSSGEIYAYAEKFTDKKHYKVKVKCTNCEYQNNHIDKLEIPVAQTVKNTFCPNCNTLNLIKKEI